MITVAGPHWKTTQQLATALAEVPENGRFVFGMRGCSNLEQLRRFSAGGVACPEWTEDVGVAYEWVLGNAVVFGRKAAHTQGKDIAIAKLYNQERRHVAVPEKWFQRDYWTKVVPDVLEEWRIHIFDGKSIARGLKVNLTGELGLIRNRGAGYVMVHANEPPKGIRQLAKQAVAALDYSYGAADLLHCKDGKMFVLEVNQAPAMDNYTRGKYVSAIRARFA